MDAIIMGPPGVGKGTQATDLAAHMGVPHIATGDLFRDAAQRGTPLGREAQGYMERGELVPDALTIALLLDRLNESDAATGALLDGFPRTLAQAEALDQALAERGRFVGRALYLTAPRAVLVERLAGRWLCRVCQTPYHETFSPPRTPGECDRCGGELYQRADDRRETIERRLDVYLEQTLPVVEYYRARGVLVEVNGDQDIAAVQQALRLAVDGDAVARA
ncbi:MAG TPA: adenylate kinase [Chloroflexota bacterium]|nr:adenylate kinase [Chloroflexota bacterium]